MFRRQWLPWGAIIWFIVASGLSIIINGWTAIAIGCAIYVARYWSLTRGLVALGTVS